MNLYLPAPVLCLAVAAVLAGAEPAAADAPWTLYVTNDCRPDYTCGYTETQTRRAFAAVRLTP